MNAFRAEQLATAIYGALKRDALQIWTKGEVVTLVVERGKIDSALRALRDDPAIAMTQLMDICAVDFPDRAERFEIVYHLLSLKHNWRLRVKTTVVDGLPVPSVTGVYSAANWFEREAWDLFGVRFLGHPDLRRILTDYGFAGHPLRKDFPLIGHEEVHYDEAKRQVVYGPVTSARDYRDLNKVSLWKGVAHNVDAGADHPPLAGGSTGTRSVTSGTDHQQSLPERGTVGEGSTDEGKKPLPGFFSRICNAFGTDCAAKNPTLPQGEGDPFSRERGIQ